MNICEVCKTEIQVEMSEGGFYMCAYCECDEEHDPRKFLSEADLKGLGELGIMPCHPKFVKGTPQNRRYEAGVYNNYNITWEEWCRISYGDESEPA